MSVSPPLRSMRLVSRLSEDGTVNAGLETIDLPPPAPMQVTVRMEAAPLHSSNMNSFFGPIDIERAVQTGTGDAPGLSAPLRPGTAELQKNRLGQAVPGGSEGVGTVVAAGEGAEALMNTRVAVWNNSTYCDYQVFRAEDCLVVPEDLDPADAATAFINPLTALGIIETARRHGYKALINTAAASNVGRMLLRLCKEEGLGLVCIVRSAATAQQMRDLGAEHVIDSSEEAYREKLVEAIDATGAMICFDAIGGKQAGDILTCMEASARKHSKGFGPYGSQELRHYYIYGALDPAPIEIPRSAGLAWTCSGWLFRPFFKELSPEDRKRLIVRVSDGLGTTFKGKFARTIGLTDVLRLDIAREYFQRKTDGKTLIRF